MLLAIDVGNTNLVFGLFAGDTLQCTWRINTDSRRSADEYQALLSTLAQNSGHDLRQEVSAAIIGSVAPQVTSHLVALCESWLGLSPLQASIDLDLDMPVAVREPRRVGIDRLLNAVAGRTLYGAPCITLDLGTATKFDVVDGSGAFIGGAIAPGLSTAAEALIHGTALLPRIDFSAPPSPIGDDTTSAMQSGIVLGYLGLIEGLLARIQGMLPGSRAPVVATGGLAGLICPLTDQIDHHNPALTLTGLRLIYNRNEPDSK